MNSPILKLKFPKPRNGYWDGGAKNGGDFTLDYPYSHRLHPGPGHYAKWGCWYLNFWFTSKTGRSWKQAASAAQRRLYNLVKVPGATVEVVYGGDK